MKPVEPSILPVGSALVTFAKDQPEYLQLPAAVDGQGTVMTEWELTEQERYAIISGGRIRLWLRYTDGTDATPRPLTPVKLEVVK